MVDLAAETLELLQRLDVAPRVPPRVHTANRPVRVHREPGNTHTIPIIIDAMSREVEPGDIINWRSGGYFGHYMAFGIVTKVDYDKGYIQVINHNKNRVTIWRTHMCVILAKANDYSNIPEEYMRLWMNDN